MKILIKMINLDRNNKQNRHQGSISSLPRFTNVHFFRGISCILSSACCWFLQVNGISISIFKKYWPTITNNMPLSLKRSLSYRDLTTEPMNFLSLINSRNSIVKMLPISQRCLKPLLERYLKNKQKSSRFIINRSKYKILSQRYNKSKRRLRNWWLIKKKSNHQTKHLYFRRRYGATKSSEQERKVI